MAKESTTKVEKKHKEKHTENDGVKKSKKDKKSRKSTDSIKVGDKDDDGDEEMVGVVTVVKGQDSDSEVEASTKVVISKDLIRSAMVPFAHPMADDKAMKKVFKGIKKSAKHKTLKRGVKEVVKSLRKCPTSIQSYSAPPPGIVVLAADISPFDVISHLPVLCEDVHVPYIFVPSRVELGAAGSTKRPTSVVMIMPDGPKAKPADAGKEKDKDGEDWGKIYSDLVKVVKAA